MDEISLNKKRLMGGIWEGVLEGAGDTAPTLQVTHQGETVDGLSVTKGDAPDTWQVSFVLPANRIADGVQTFLISEVETGIQLASFAVLAGEALSDDIRAEMDLLREELDMLKKAFRRHCLETL